MLPSTIYVTETREEGKLVLAAADSKEELIGYDDQGYVIGVYELKKKVSVRRVQRIEEVELG